MGFEMLRMMRIHNVVELGHRTYMVMNVLEDHFGSVYTGHQMMEAIGPGQNFSAYHLNCMVRLVNPWIMDQKTNF